MRKSLELYRRALGEEHPKVARGLYYVSMSMPGAGSESEESMQLLRQGIAIMRKNAPDNVNLPYMLQTLASRLLKRTNLDADVLAEAENLILEAKTLFTRHYGKEHVATLSADTTLAQLERRRGNLKKAESIIQDNVAQYRLAKDGEHGYIWSLFELGDICLELGKATEAEAFYKQAEDEGRKHWRADDPQLARLATALASARARSKQR